MMDTARKLYDLLDRRERIRLGLLFCAMLIMAFLQMASIASVMPFLSVAANPDAVHSNAWLAWAYDALGFTSTNRFLVGLGILALIALVLSNAWMAATQWAQLRFVRGRTHRLSVKLLGHYLAQPYVWFLRRNSAELGKNILAEVGEVTGVLMSSLQLAAKTIVAVAILALLIAFDPLLALSVAVVIGGAYGGIYLGVRKLLSKLGAARVKANRERFKAAGEAFGAIKDVKLLGKERAFLSRFRRPSECATRVGATASVIKMLPRYALETFAFGGILIIAILLLVRGGGVQEVVPILGLYVFAGYRLMPNLQLIYTNAVTLRFGTPALDNIHGELIGSHDAASDLALPDGAGAPPRRDVGRFDASAPLAKEPHSLILRSACSARPRGLGRALSEEGALTRHGHGNGAEQASSTLALSERLELEHVSFTYPGAHRPALRDVSLTILANTTVGIMGPTGSGKTTLVDVILGLLRPDSGEIRVDGVELTNANLRGWQFNLGYVPQHIYLTDDSIAANIAFGVAPERVDRAAVERAARLAQIHTFIADELPQGYETVVGERGIRLSGGQRQRIGIARALYHDPALLVFDEATSALDDETEAAVMEEIPRLAGTRTIILIAHRLTTLKDCDAIVHVKAGKAGIADSCSLLATAG